MRRAVTLVAVVGLFFVGGCSSSDSAEPDVAESSPATSLEAELTLDVVVNADGSVSVSAESNLPDGTELMGSVFAEGGYHAQDTQTLRGGSAAFGPFSDKGSPLPPGTYDVSVTMPIARNQPDEVKAVIGEHGENMTGAQVSKESITGDAVVEASQQLVIP